MDIEVRALKAKDTFPMFTILSKIGLKDLKESLTPERLKEIVSAFKQIDQEDSQIDMASIVGANVLLEVLEIIMRNLPLCENEIYAFLANLTNKTPEEIGNLGMVEFAELILAVLKREEFKDFFTAVAKQFS